MARRPKPCEAADAYAASEQGESPWLGRWRAGAGETAPALPVARAPDGALHVWAGGRDVRVERGGLAEPEQHARRPAGAAAAGVARIVAPMPGAVLRLEVAEGDVVEERRPLLVLEAMKMEHPVWAPFAGRIVRVDCREGQQVAAGDLLLELDAGRLEVAGEEAAGDDRHRRGRGRRPPRRPCRERRSSRRGARPSG